MLLRRTWAWRTLVRNGFGIRRGGILDDVAVAATDAGHSPTLLLVEDDILIRMEISGRLRSASFKVIEAVHGEEALALLRSSVRVDVVLTDLHMPHMDGAALVQQIRAEFPHLPVFMTSGQLPGQTVYGMLDGFFSKPLAVATFTSHLQASCIFRKGHIP